MDLIDAAVDVRRIPGIGANAKPFGGQAARDVPDPDVRPQARGEPVTVGSVSERVPIERIVSQSPAPER